MARQRTVPGNVIRRASGRFAIWYWDAAGVKQRQAAKSADEAGARAELAAILERVARGEAAFVESGDLTISAWGRRWVELRREAGKGEADNEAAHLEHHILPELGRHRLRTLTAAQVLDFVRRLPSREVATGTGETLAPVTVHHIAGTLRLMCKEAAKRGLIAASPCVWDASDLPERGAPDVGEGFSEEEVLQLVSDAKVPEDRRMLYALEFLTGQRTGEAAMRRFHDWEKRRAPLTGLKVETAWSTKKKIEKETKTRVRRTIPVHPVLAAMLASWEAEGFERFTARAPTPEDLIVPGPDGKPRANNASWRDFQKDLAALGLDAQRHYESRSTFLSLGEAGGGDVALLRLLTHPSPKTAADLYRRLRLLWPRLCEAVCAIRIGAAPARAA